MDRLLDETRSGPQYLSMPEVAEVVVATPKRGDAMQCAATTMLALLRDYAEPRAHVGDSEGDSRPVAWSAEGIHGS